MNIHFNIRKNRYKKVSDEELIIGYQNTEDTKIIAELYNRYSHLVFGVSLKYLLTEDKALDAVNDIFANLLADLKKYQISNFSSWLHSYTRNHSLQLLRKDKKIVQFHDKIQEPEIDDWEDEPSFLIRELKLDLLEKALQSLNDDQSTCIKHFYLNKLTYQEIADQTSMSLKQVKSNIQNGKRNLKILLSNKNENARQG